MTFAPQLLPRATRPIRNCTSDDARYLHLFFSYKESDKQQAKEMCKTCPVKIECRQAALDNNVDFGVWGGWDFSNIITRPAILKSDRDFYAKVEKVTS